MTEFAEESVDFVSETKPKSSVNPSCIFIEQNSHQALNKVTVKSECDFSSYLEEHVVFCDIKPEEIKLEDYTQFDYGADLDKPMCSDIFGGSCKPCESNILSGCEQKNGDLLQAVKIEEEISDARGSNSASEECCQAPNTPKTQKTGIKVATLCAHCYCICSTEREFQTHMWLKHREEIPDLRSKLNMNWFFPCDICDYMAVRSFEIEKHKMTHHDKCKHCEFHTDNPKTLLTHYVKIHGKDYGRVCELCSKVYKTPLQLADHLFHTHKCDKGRKLFKACNFTLYSCEICTDFQTVWPYEYTEHIYNFHKNQMYGSKLYGSKLYCGKCDYSTTKNSNMESHIYNKHYDYTFKCSYCNDHNFKRKDVLVRHILKQHKERVKSGQRDILGMRLYTCSSCGLISLSMADHNKHKDFVHKH